MMSCVAFLHTKPLSKKGFTLKYKNLLQESYFRPNSERRQNNFLTRVTSPENVAILLKPHNNYSLAYHKLYRLTKLTCCIYLKF